MKYKLKGTWLEIDIKSLFVNTIQDFFDNYIPSKKNQHLLIQNKNILLDGNPVKREDDIAGLFLCINIYPESYNYQKLNYDINIVYEDEFILVVNKPKDLIVHSDGANDMSLTKIVQSYYYDKNYICCQPIHRLDKETSGLVVYSKSIVFQPLFDLMLSKKQIRRNYYAFVNGVAKVGSSFIINKPIGNDRHNANKKIIYNKGQSAITKINVIKSNIKNNYSIMECSLDTGRTHQIRLHLASEGYHILNDELYGIRSNLCNRMGLFAYNVDLYHPLKEDNISIETNLPIDLEKLFLEEHK